MSQPVYSGANKMYVLSFLWLMKVKMPLIVCIIFDISGPSYRLYELSFPVSLFRLFSLSIRTMSFPLKKILCSI